MKPDTQPLLPSHFKDFCVRQSLCDKALLLLVSGGVDSMTLLHVASQCHPKEQLHVLHLNHQTRESNQDDAILVQKFCSQLGIDSHVATLEEKPTKNIEAHWRTWRQETAESFRKKLQCEATLTAHHATDLVETMLFRLTKGCGAAGLSPFDTSTKPFWQIPKDDIIAYAKAHEVPFLEDPTNDDERYQRNIIRHHVLPHLRRITPHLESVFVKESQIFGSIDEYLEQQTKAPPSSDNTLPLSDFLSFPPALQTTFLRSCCPSPPSFDELQDCLRWLQNDPKGNTKKDLGGITLSLHKGRLMWNP